MQGFKGGIPGSGERRFALDGMQGPDLQVVFSHDDLVAAIGLFLEQQRGGGSILIASDFTSPGGIVVPATLNGLTITGIGRPTITATEDTHLFEVAADNFTISSLRLVGTGDTGSRAVYVNNTSATINGLSLIDLICSDFDDFALFFNTPATQARILNNVLNDAGLQVDISDSVVANNVVEVSGTYDAVLLGGSGSLSNNVLTGNMVKASTGNAIDTSGGTNNLVVGNVAYDSASPGSGTSLNTAGSDTVANNEV